MLCTDIKNTSRYNLQFIMMLIFVCTLHRTIWLVWTVHTTNLAYNVLSGSLLEPIISIFFTRKNNNVQ